MYCYLTNPKAQEIKTRIIQTFMNILDLTATWFFAITISYKTDVSTRVTLALIMISNIN